MSAAWGIDVMGQRSVCGCRAQPFCHRAQQFCWEMWRWVEVWWHNLYDWSMAVKGYRLFKKNGPRKRGSEAVFCVRAAGVPGTLPGDG